MLGINNTFHACALKRTFQRPHTHIHRTREKINRPQTRRRRDNSEELLDKMRLLQANLRDAKAIMEEVVRRERRKRDLAVRLCYCAVLFFCVILRYRPPPGPFVEAYGLRAAVTTPHSCVCCQHVRHHPSNRTHPHTHTPILSLPTTTPTTVH